MREITDINEIKRIITQTLKTFDAFCRSHNILYSIGYGTMLGAVRHHGFIPWDDDVDVIMSRENYNKLLSVCDALDSNYSLVSINNCNGFMAPLAKIIDNRTLLIQKNHAGEKVQLGIYIDVFVYDVIPQNKSLKKSLYRIQNILQKAWSFSENSYHLKRHSLISTIRKSLNKTKIARVFSCMMNSIAKKKRKGQVYSNLMYSVYNREREEIDNNELLDLSEYHFEDLIVFGVKDYDKYLRKLYGDYLKLPPEEKRVTHHNYTAYYK